MRTYVISDLHIGAGPLDDCDKGCEETLVAFINAVRQVAGPVELILNGDSFDFVQAEPWRGKGFEATADDGVALCFTQKISDAKAAAIVAAHPAIFDALAALVERPDATLTILPGNHDADLYWDEVRERLTRRICGSTPKPRLNWVLDRVYRPSGAPALWVEHGHQFDPINCFFHPKTTPPTEHWSRDRPPILGRPGEERRLMECTGTRFLIRFLNELDSRYPFVDNIKPFSRFLAIFGSSLNTLRGGTARAALSGLAFLRFGSTESLSNLLSAAGAADSVAEALAQIEHASGSEFSRALQEAGFDFEGRSFDFFIRDADAALRLLDFALAHLDALDQVGLDESSLSIGGGDGNLSLLGGLSVDETQALRDAAADILKTPGVACVVMGHTHEGVDEPRYKNTGSWTRYLQIEPGAAAPGWSEMVARADSLPLVPRYVLADSGSGTVAMLNFSGTL